MVLAVVLRGSSLSAYLIVGTVGRAARTLNDSRAHSGNHIIVCPARGFGVMTTRIGRVEWQSLYLTHYVRYIIISTVGYRRAEIGHLQRRKIDLSLAD